MTQIDEENSKFKDGVNRNARLMVRNISFKATEDALKKHFSKYGTVEEAKLLKRPDGKLVGCGFVHFTHVDMANKAIAATNKKPFLERPINVTWALQKEKYLEKLGQKTVQANDRNTKPQFQKQIRNEDVPENLFSDEEDDSIKKENSATEVKDEKKNQPRVNRNARLIVRNVSFKATEESLKEHFEPFGNVLETKLLKKPDGKLVGCAFVLFKNIPMAKKALLNTNMKPYLGRPISVDWAVAKDKYMQHIVNKQLEMQEDVKKEESDSDDDGPVNTSKEALKEEIKSESDEEDDASDDEDDDDDDKKVKSESDDESQSSDDEDNDDDDEEEESDDDDQNEEMETESQIDNQEKQRIKLNDAEDGCTVFLTNVAFSVDNDQLKQFAEQTGPVRYALICMDKMTEHSKGSGFVKFQNKEDADTFLGLPADQLRLEEQVLQVKPALKRENLQAGNKKEAKDNRNLYLVKEGVVVAGTKAAEGVSSSDMAKRLALERSKTQMLKNLNRFVSRYRIVVSNLPPLCDDVKLRRMCVGVAGRNAVVTEARIMRDLRAEAPGPDGKYPSKGYGFVMFTRHEDALHSLRKLNNNPDIFDKNNRPIVSFSIEDRTALNARKKRLEKSIANNPLQNQNTEGKGKRNRKRKHATPPDESYVKKGRFDNKNQHRNDSQNRSDQNRNDNQNGNDQKNANQHRNWNQNKKANQRNKNEGGRFVRNPQDQEYEQYTGLTAKEGAQHKMRSNQKLRAQADLHKQTVKNEKKNSGRAWALKMAAKERVKQPKQKMNNDKSMPSRRNKKFRKNAKK